MAMTNAVWGIDIGQCALKALRCQAHEDQDNLIVVDAFDYVEYPKILSQPGADPEELISDALKQFLSRNTIKGDRVAISVPGQSGLARFIKLPPVEAKKIPDIVRYEARQQIPFDLNDVIWDYQRMGGGSEEEGFALETEVGLFAMKRDAVFRALAPFQKAGIEIDFVQLTPLALYNFILFDQLGDLPPADQYDPENPPESLVILSLGTDATDLVVTNGYRVWQRSIPLGGNHFTKALTKELKLTFAKAEHLKRNATAAQDPKAVFQAMRPVFSDLLTELQRSIGYFTGIDRTAKISHVVGLGNAMKLSGLRRYLSQSLGFEVKRVEEFRGLVGSQVLSAPVFKDNVLSFGVCYGLGLQGLGKSGLRTSLLPREIVNNRLIRQKKPWAVAAAAVLLLAFSISFYTSSHAHSSVDVERWKSAEEMAVDKKDKADDYVRRKGEAEEKFNEIKDVGEYLVGNVERRILWQELLHVLNYCLPRDDPSEPIREDIAERKQLHVTSLECQPYDDLSEWYKGVEKWYQPPEAEAAAAPAAAPGNPGGESAEEGPTGPGWVIMVSGYHYHNFARPDPNKAQGAEFVRKTLINNLHIEELQLPTADRKTGDWFTTKELGIGYPVLVNPERVKRPDPETGLRRFDFLVEFCWQQATPTERQEKRNEGNTAQNQAPN